MPPSQTGLFHQSRRMKRSEAAGGKTLSRVWLRWPKQDSGRRPGGQLRARWAWQGAGPDPGAGPLRRRGLFPVSSPIGVRAAGGARRLPIGRLPGPAPRSRRRVAEPAEPAVQSYQRGQLVACPCASAPAQFNGHCPPAPLFRRRHFLRGWAGAGGQETLRAEAQIPRPPQLGVRGDGHLPWATLGSGPGDQLGSAQPFPLGLSLPICRVSQNVPWGEPGGGWAQEIRPGRAGVWGRGRSSGKGCPSQVCSRPGIPGSGASLQEAA